MEVGGRLKHFRLSSKNIVKDLKKNLHLFGIAEEVTLINGRSLDKTIIVDVSQRPFRLDTTIRQVGR